MRPAKLEQHAYVPEIDGLRAYAVFAVLLFHAFPDFGTGGFIGVDIFFVISGFVISRTYLDRLIHRDTSISKFYLRRIRRLAPAYMVVLIFTTVLAALVLDPRSLLSFGKSLIAQPLYSQNFVFWYIGDYFDEAISKPLLHTWSLAVEEQFYLLFGLVILVLRKWKNLMTPLLVVAFLISLALGLFVVDLAPKTSFFLLPTRIWEFVLGIGAFLVTRKLAKDSNASIYRTIYWFSLLCLLISVFVFDKSSDFPSIQAYIACLGTAMLLVVFECSHSDDYRIFRSRVAQFLGQRSYSLYLWHWPLIAITATTVGHELAWHYALLLLFLSLLLSDLTYRYVEDPIRRKQVIAGSTSLIRGFAVTSVAIIATGALLIFSKGLLQRYDEPIRTYLEAAQYTSPYRCSPVTRVLTPDSEFCLARESDPSLSSRKGLLILGDSHADAVDGVIAQTGNSFEVPVYLTVRSCTLSRYGATKYCNEAVREKVYRQIEESNIGAVIAISFRKTGWLDSPFIENLRMLTELGVIVFLVETVPNGDYFAPSLRAESLLIGNDGLADAYDESSYIEKHSDEIELFERIESEYEGKVHVLRPRRYLCEPAGSCDFDTNGYPNYSDTNHLTRVGGERLRPMFAKALESLSASQN